MQQIKEAVYRLTNHLQGVIGYLEIKEYDKALEISAFAAKELHDLSAAILVLSRVVQVEIGDDEVRIVPSKEAEVHIVPSKEAGVHIVPSKEAGVRIVAKKARGEAKRAAR